MVVLIVVIIFIVILLINAYRGKSMGRKLTNQIEVLTNEDNIRYAKELANLIRCKTIYNKRDYDDTEFSKLRDELKSMFPNIYEKGEVQVFSTGCLIYKIEGVDKSRNIMLMSHHDVVEATGGWKHDPFLGEIIDGKIWGRGTVDTKTSFFAELMALEELLKEGFKPEVNVYIGSSNNEEASGDGIPTALQYFKENNISFELVLDEGGAIIDPPMPGMKDKAAMIAVHEKGRHPLKCTATTDFGHFGLSPNKDTPIVRMAKFISEVDKEKTFIKKIYPEVKEMFIDLSPYMTLPMRIIFSNLWIFSPILKIIMPKLNPQAGAMLGTMCYFTNIKGGQTPHIQTKDVEATAFMRCVNDEDLKKDIETLKKIADKYGIIIEDGDGCEYYKPADLKAKPYSYVKECINSIFPQVAVAPYILPAGTDGRHLTEICNCVLRFAPINITKEQFASVHNINENINIKAIGDAVLFYKKVIRSYK